MEAEIRPTLEALFREHYTRLVRGLSVGAGSVDDAADAVQEAFVELTVRWNSIVEYEDPVGWVRRVAVNRLLKRRRSLERRARALVRLGPAGSHADAPPDVDLERAVAALPLQQRLAVSLHYVAGLTVAETAEAMGIAKGTADTHLHRARQALRPSLEVER